MCIPDTTLTKLTEQRKDRVETQLVRLQHLCFNYHAILLLRIPGNWVLNPRLQGRQPPHNYIQTIMCLRTCALFWGRNHHFSHIPMAQKALRNRHTLSLPWSLLSVFSTCLICLSQTLAYSPCMASKVFLFMFLVDRNQSLERTRTMF